MLLQPKRKDNKYSAYNHGISTDYPDQREKRISGSKNFRSPPQKDFCNNICHRRTHATQRRAPLFNYLVRASEQRWRDRKTQCLCGLTIHDQLEFSWRLDRQIARSGAL